MADWKALQIKIPGEDLLEQVRGVLESLLIYLEIVKVTLETVKVFLIDYGNPLRALLESLLNLILQLFTSLKKSGVYGWFDIPNPLKDPGFNRFKGGYQAFTQRFKASLFDSKDPFRPQPAPGITRSGFVLLVADGETVFGMLKLMGTLLRFFGRDLISPQYAAPTNVKVFPAGQKLGGTTVDPILQVASVFGATLKGLAIEWSLATNQLPPDPGYNDLIATVGAEFIPQKWLIEKTSREGGPENVLVSEETHFEDKKGKPIKRQRRLRDKSGDYFRKFEKYYVLEPSTNGPSFFLGQLGTFRYIDTDNIAKDKTYYYRVRAFSGPLDVNPDGTLTLPPPTDTKPSSGELIQEWPTKDPENPIIMGRPSGILTGRIPNIPSDFDVIAVLKATFRMAFALGFQLEANPEATFDAEGRPTVNTSPKSVGQGSLANLGGPLSTVIPSLDNSFLLGAGSVQFSDNGAISAVTADPVSGEYPDVTHNYFNVKLHAARLTSMVTQALLDNSSFLISLRALYQGPLPKPIPAKGYFRSGVTTIEKMVLAFVNLPDNFPTVYDPKVYETYNAAYLDTNTRLNLLDVVNYVKSFTLGGVPPNWISISVLRDIVPFSGQFIYELLARIDGLLAAFKSFVDEVKAFIDLVVRKIDAMERFIKFLVEILNYLDSFSAGFYILSVPDTDAGIPGWISAIDQAGGTRPPSGPGGYTAGIALAYSGTDVDAFSKAFSIIF